MKIKTKDLTGAALDWAVAKCEGVVNEAIPNPLEYIRDFRFSPSTDWSQGGPIIERKGIQVTPDGVGWNAIVHKNIFKEDGSEAYQQGKTFLIAAMRCYVASELGDEVDVPEELV